MYQVPENVINAVLQYLNTQPYGQVAAMINAIGQCDNVPVNKCPTPKPEKE
ncbi:MAG: hypothetical protein KAS32_10835 [Candidatus Peribacteraceae bacterium]|nr:hypothetical protein [Candidatus Peribacteraceae bacterium]